MKVFLLGTGGPKPDPNRQGPSLVILVDNQLLLFDAGRGVATQLVRSGISIKDVNPIFITHHHFDHIGNLGDIILSSWNLGRKEPLLIHGPEGTTVIVDTLLTQVYKNDISFRLTEARLSGAKLADIQEMVNTKDVNPGLIYNNNGVKVFTEYVQHGHGLGIPQESWKCLGYRIEAHGETVAISGDTIDCQGLDKLAKNADILVMCCYLSKKELSNVEGGLVAKYILACSPQVGKIVSKAKVRKLVLTHIREKNDDLIQEMIHEIKIDYEGEIIVGRDLLKVDV